MRHDTYGPRGRRVKGRTDPRSIGALMRVWSQQTLAVMRRAKEEAEQAPPPSAALQT